MSEKDKKEENTNPILRLLDPEDGDPISLYDDDDNKVDFEQIALIPYQDKLYAILKPIVKMEGIADDEAIVFAFEEDEDETQLLVAEESDAIIDEVFAIYNQLIEEDEEK